MKRIQAWICILLLTVPTLCLFGCAAKPPVLTEDHGRNSVTRQTPTETGEDQSGRYHAVLPNEKSNTVAASYAMTRCIGNGNYYFIDGGALYKYDLHVGEVLPACTDPGCPHDTPDCISFRLPGNGDGESGGRLLFVHQGVIYTQRGNTLYAYNEKTSKTELFFDCTQYGVLLNACPRERG